VIAVWRESMAARPRCDRIGAFGVWKGQQRRAARSEGSAAFALTLSG